MKHILILMAAYLIASLLMQFILPTQQFLLEGFTETLSLTKADALLSKFLKYRWVGIALTPAII